MMRSSKPLIHPAIQERINFFERLKSDVEKASIGSEIRILYEKFSSFCLNLGITHALGNHAYDNETCNDDFRKELLSNIDMAKSVCKSKRDGLSSTSSLTINNTNHQEQSQNLSVQIKEELRRSLTGEQYDELLVLINNKADKKTIAEKIKDFGIDVASRVLAAIITNKILN